ncbi:MAG: SMC-Scp complex subunit ScpB [Bacteroidetes bacterium]|nr:SMC-Scp complex subunit ScpB [Bacteroidota bacterium]
MNINNPLFLNLNRTEQKNIIETIIFAGSSDDNLTAENIKNILLNTNNKNNNPPKIKNNTFPSINEYFQDAVADNNKNNNQEIDFPVEEIINMIDEINSDLESTNRPYRIVDFAGIYQFATLPQYGEIVENMLNNKVKKRFTNAQIETLAIIAYKQPVTKPEIDKIRGVMSSSEIINVLIEKGLVEIAGRKDIVGKPLLYVTTNDFLKTFGLNTLYDLPKLTEIEEIAEQKLKEEAETSPEIILNVQQEDIDNLNNEGVELDIK